MPGHTFPMRAGSDGVLERLGQAEAVVDLCRLAGLSPAGVVCDVISADGSMASAARLRRLAHLLGIGVVSVSDVYDYRVAHERVIERVAETVLPCESGMWKAIGYRSKLDTDERVALVLGDPAAAGATLVAPHRHQLFADVFQRESSPLQMARRQIEAEGRGVILYSIPSRPGVIEAPCDGAEGMLGPAERQILDDLGVLTPVFPGGTW